ncbi:MAG: 50S ribosomal protein L16 3-hydroxylase [Alphaproteobacteria bacterium]|jgi:50S ribosomal protein L16 3-hydroxylase
MIITDFDPHHFVKEYWQKKPCLIKNFVADFIDPLDENDLAGLAQEEGVDSRIVSNTKGVWDVHQGPFDDFEPHCKGDWALLVQGVNNYIDEVDALSQLVDFIPYWRFDDVMVSYSTKNAGVGAHTDQYDVFIIQGKGSRRWQVGLPNDSAIGNNTITPHPLLKQIADFDAVIDEILLPGDAIYIPPKHPHRGNTLSPCLNYSLGFRAPTNLEVLTGLLDESDNIQQAQTRYTDADIHKLRVNNVSPMQVSNNELSKLKNTLVELLDSPQAEQALLQYLSRQGLPTDQEELPDYATDEIFDALIQGAIFEKLPGVKPIYGELQLTNFSFYIDGNMFVVDSCIVDQAIALLETPHIQGLPEGFAPQLPETAHWLTLATQLINSGYWEIAEND